MLYLPSININKGVNSILRLIKANKPTLYATGASAGVILTGFSSAKAAIKSKKVIEENDDFKKTFVNLGKLWISPVVIGGVTIFCIWRGHHIHLEREASLAAMSAFWKEKYTELENKVSSKLGEEQLSEIKEEIQKDKLAGRMPPSTEYIPKGVFYVYDEFTDQIIKTSTSRFAFAVGSINKKFANYENVPYNYFIRLLGGKPNPHVEDYGWSWDNEDLIDTMSYNGFGMYIDADVDYYTKEWDHLNKEHDGELVPHLTFNYCPEHLYYSQK